MSQHAKNMEKRRLERERKRLEEEARAAAAAAEEADGPDNPSSPEPSTGTGVAVIPPPAQPNPRSSRPQPLTPDLIPEPEILDATGELSADELNDLALCERAFAHAAEAAWMKGKAAEAVRSRRLYRGGGRTWAMYCEEEIGESESDVNRQIQEWPLAAAVSELANSKKAAPAAHIRALLPLAKWAGVAETADAYVKLRAYAADRGLRVTAAAISSLVERFSKPADPLPVAQFGAAVRAIAPQVPAQGTQGATAASASGGGPDAGARPGAPEGSPGVPPTVSSPPSQPSTGHPNLGDRDGAGDDTDPVQGHSAPEVAGESDTIDAEIVDEGRAVALLAALTRAGETLREDLQNATPATLKSIAVAARNIADAAENLL